MFKIRFDWPYTGDKEVLQLTEEEMVFVDDVMQDIINLPDGWGVPA